MTLKLKAEKRDLKEDVNKLRSEGKVPAVFYGAKTDSTPITVDKKEFIKIFREAGETTVIALDLDGKNIDVLIHDISQNPISDEVDHIDFYVIDKSKTVKVEIPLDFVGESPAVKNLGGTLVKTMHELEVEGLPDKLPHSIETDISKLENLDSVITVKNVHFPDGVVALAGADEAIASVSVQKEEEEEQAEADLSSIEVEKKGKEDIEGSN